VIAGTVRKIAEAWRRRRLLRVRQHDEELAITWAQKVATTESDAGVIARYLALKLEDPRRDQGAFVRAHAAWSAAVDAAWTARVEKALRLR
jgi:hypothetical protein